MSRGPRCDAPCPYGGTSAARKYSRADLGHMGHCNRPVRNEGERCWQHPDPVPCEHCCGSGNTKVHVKGATVDAPCTPCAGQGVVEP